VALVVHHLRAVELDDGGRLLWIPESKTEAGRRTVEVPALLRPHLKKLAKGRAGDALLFGGIKREDGTVEPHLRGWILFWTKKICEAAGVPKVSAHSLRGLHSTVALQAGATSHLVAATLGHASDQVTLQSYAAPGAGHSAKAARTLGVLTGGRRRR
jgi:integrase